MSSSSVDQPFTIQLSFQGKTVEVEATVRTTADELVALAHCAALQITDPQAQSQQLKLLWKGKRLTGDQAVFTVPPKKAPRIMVLATDQSTVTELSDSTKQRSDPTIRGFDQELKRPAATSMDYWGPHNSQQDKNYKFCRFQACTWQSFGHRPVDSTPHDFAALRLLQQLATDPGIVAVLKERELVVGTLGEMDPIDDRLMQQKQQHGACLLGYNTNGGARIDLKLRTDDLQGFRPYSQIAATLLHELSHNWVGDHNALFWTNYGQMRAEYLWTHRALAAAGCVVRGQTTAQMAGLPPLKHVDDVFQCVVQELTGEMAQHGLHPSAIAAAVRDRCDELERSHKDQTTGRQPGGGGGGSIASNSSNPREMALQAAERRRREQSEKKPDTE